MNLLHRIDTRAKVAACREVVEVFLIGALLFEKDVGQVVDLLELAVPRDQVLGFVEHGHTVAHVLERDSQFFLALPNFIE